jgi:uncharacterized protein YggL (DUF469 family)
MLKMLSALYYPEENLNFVYEGNPLRKVLEYIFHIANKYGLLPDDCIEANGLNCEGNLTDNGCNITARAEDPTQTNEAQRQAVKAWLDGRDDVEVKSFGELVDAWYNF